MLHLDTSIDLPHNQNSHRGKQLSDIVSFIRHRADQIFVAICVNTKKDNQTSSGIFSTSTEYLSASELNEILQSLAMIGITARHYSESELISLLMADGFAQIGKRHRMVYSARGSGAACSRSCKIPALCESRQIRTCSPDSCSIGLAANKFHTLRLLQAEGLPIPKSWLLTGDGVWLRGDQPEIGCKVIAKPCYESASIGVDGKAIGLFSPALLKISEERARLLKQPMLVQTFISGYEVEVPVLCLGDRVIPLPPIGIEIDGNRRLKNEILDYERVHDDRYGFYGFEAVCKHTSATLCRTASSAARALMFRGMVRIDFRVTERGSPFIMDVNALPHLTRHSSCARSFSALNLSYEDLLSAVIACGIEPPDWECGSQFIHSTNI